MNKKDIRNQWVLNFRSSDNTCGTGDDRERPGAGGILEKLWFFKEKGHLGIIISGTEECWYSQNKKTILPTKGISSE